MAGKPYGIREMKVIVDYLVEQKAFGEIRGRKRWMDLANSQMTTRTWQSLKETFLKRILPDIHNPYYKLTVAQISSFREGRDVAAMQSSNKLEIRTASEDSNNIEENQEQIETSETTNLNKDNQEESTAGETISSKIPPHSRSSVETLVLDHEGEEPEDDEMKSMRDRIIYTEPLTPMIQQVIDDFNSDDEVLQIDENPKTNNTETEPEQPKTIGNEDSAAKEPTKDLNNDVHEKLQENDKSNDIHEKTQQNDETIPKVNGKIENGRNVEAGQSQTQKTNTSTDSTIPNNQEVLGQNGKPENTEKTEKDKNVNKFTETQQNEENNNVDTRSRKRTASNSTNKAVGKSPTPDKQENLCLKSVSLFAEQFSAPTFVDSDSSLDAQDQGPEKKKKETELPKIKVDTTKDVVLLKSHTDSDSEPRQKAKITQTVNKTQTISKTRSKAMANIFGFSSGGVHGKHMGLGKKLAHHKKIQDIVISDSEWTSESDAEFVSPPRTRKNRRSRKYIRPNSARILSLEEEGGLFVVHGRKIYPLVKDGKMIKNYVNYFEELDADDDDEEESYWKLKYAQEKIKTAELSKLLKNNSDLPSKTETTNSKDKNRRQSAKKPKLDTDMSENEGSENATVKPKEAVKQNEANIKIKFTGHHQEVQLEGHWSQIHPVLQQVVNIFQKDPENNESKDNNETKPENNKGTTQNVNTNSKTESNEEVPIKIKETSEERDNPKRDITELEANIFKEIEEKDKEEKAPTRSRGRPINNDLQPSSAKVAKLDEKKADVSQKRSTPRKKESETTHNFPQTRKSLKEDDSQEILYKFPSPSPTNLRSNVRLSLRQKSKTQNLRYMENLNNTSPENKSLHSESTQGYHDSDISPISRRIRRRRKHSFSSLKNLPSKHRVKRFTRRRSHSDLKIDFSSDSSNSSFNIPRKTAVFRNSTLNSDIYKSDSYQLLMPKAVRPFKLLESIDETKPVERNPILSGDHDNSDALSIKSHDTLIISMHNDERNSSNVSLPVSPELSIVEKLSVNKSLLSSDIDFPTINEIQNNETEPNTNNKYMLSEVDTTLPLMQQDCSFYKQNNACDDYERAKTKPTDSRLKAINATNTQKINSPSKSLHAKLRDLILNSAKKIVDMSIDTTRRDEPMEVDSSKVEPKKIRKKRSSTPQKRKSRVTKTKNNPPVIEERVEFCSNGGRHSCPPSVLAPIENVTTKTTAKEISDTQKTKATKKKKDIIKVKILRPKSRTPKKSKSKSSQDESRKGSTETSLGTNESGVFVQTANDTIDLIHNHSETCLHAHDCIDPSVEILPEAKSHITINSDSNTIDDFLSEDLADFNIPEMYCSNAQDASDFNIVPAQAPVCQDTVNPTPHVSDLSIFTEDLSDELPTPLTGKSSKWYLLSEDETTNTDLQPLRGGLTANLNQIFPVVCAVPDLSTITEISKDADSRKPTFESDRDDLDSICVGIVSN